MPRGEDISSGPREGTCLERVINLFPDTEVECSAVRKIIQKWDASETAAHLRSSLRPSKVTSCSDENPKSCTSDPAGPAEHVQCR